MTQNDEMEQPADAQETFPEDIVEPENALPEITLDDLSTELRQATANAGWGSLMPVQAKAMPYLLAKRDLLVQSRTGSGKTGAFLLPILAHIDVRKKECQALILVPTRELAQQVKNEADVLFAESGAQCAAIYGGVKYGPQISALENGVPLIVGTPGRTLDHLLRRTLTLDKLRVLVFDEADRMLSMGFYPDMRELQQYLPNAPYTATMFSATFPQNVLRLAGEFLHEHEFLSLSRDRVYVSDTEHGFCNVPAVKKDRALIRLLEVINPPSAIIFCNTKAKVHYLAVVLQRFGYDADELSADLNQNDRERVLGRVREGSLRFLIATDVAARGIDIPELSHVFQYEAPEDPESYIHRAGRTGRAGAAGVAITLIENFSERVKLDTIAKRYELELVEHPLPDDDDVAGLVSERMTVLLESHLRTRDKLQAERMQRLLPMVQHLGESEEGQALMALLLDDFYQLSLHGTPPQPIGKPSAPKASGSRRGGERNNSGRSRSSGSRSSGSRPDRSSSRSSGSRSSDSRSSSQRSSKPRSSRSDSSKPKKGNSTSPRNAPSHSSSSDAGSSKTGKSKTRRYRSNRNSKD